MTINRRASAIAGVVLVVLALAAPAAGARGLGGWVSDDRGQTDPTTTTTAPPEDPPDIIPRPNSGEDPGEAGDRGGGLQLGLLAALVVAVGGGVALVIRQSRKARLSR